MPEQIFRKMTADEIEKWYVTDFSEAFAENERKPLADIFILVEQGRYEIWGLFEKNRLLGYATLWKCEGIPLILLDYLGVRTVLRNNGLGAKILKVLKEKGAAIVTESEMPVKGDRVEENQIRIRRIGFYRRNGFIPAYEMATCGMRWQALLANCEGMDSMEIMQWHRALYGEERTDVRIPLGPDETPELPYWMK